MSEPIETDVGIPENESPASTSTSSATSSSTTPSIEKMFGKIIGSPNAFFRSQQKNEPDLNESEKQSICRRLYFENSTQFLSRYHRFLDSGDIVCFANCKNVDENSIGDFDYYLQDLAKRKPPIADIDRADQANRAVAKNRRYGALKRLIANGDYFGDYEMRERDPLLYDQMIGQYQTQNEQRAAFHSGDRQTTVFSDLLLDMYDAKELSNRRREQQAQQTAFNHPFWKKTGHENDEEDELESEEEDANDSADADRTRNKISNAEKQDLREAFVREMQERFLDGKDSGFDYRTVDENPEYDPVDLQTRDDEDKYFDDEEPQECRDRIDDD